MKEVSKNWIPKNWIPKNWIQSTAVIYICIALVACDKKADSPPPANAEAMALPVTVMEALPVTVPETIEAIGQTEGAKEVEVRPRVGGILLKRLYEEGASIKAGQAMFLIDPVPFQIALTQSRAKLAQQKAVLEQAQREESRLKKMLESQSISQRDYDNAVSDTANALATLQQAEANVKEAELNLSYTTVTAPVSGVSGRFQFSEGALVAANSSLLTTLVQLQPIWVRFSLSDSDLTAIGGQLSMTRVKAVRLLLPDGTEYSKTGQLNFAASQISPQLGTQSLRAAFENTDQHLLPGQFVRVRVVTGQREGVFLLPQTAILSGEQGKFVYLANAANEAEIRPIQVGGWQGSDWVVYAGLNAGDRVVLDNLIKLRPGAKLAVHQVEALTDKAKSSINEKH